MADEEIIICELGHTASLTAAVTAMLIEASDLPDPGHMTIYGIIDGTVHDAVTIQFPQAEASTEAITLWAIRFGAVVGSWTDHFNGVPTRWVRAKFTWLDFLEVDLFAAIPLPQGATIPADEDSEPVTATPF
jgi:hypothetical protein